MNDKVREFIEDHNADDVYYASTPNGSKYFGLSDEEVVMLCGFIFRTIKKEQAILRGI